MPPGGRDAHAYNLSAIRPYECRERVDQLIGRDERRRNRTTVTKLVVLIHNRPFDARSADINSKQLPHGRSPLAQCVYMLGRLFHKGHEPAVEQTTPKRADTARQERGGYGADTDAHRSTRTHKPVDQ